MFFKIKFQNKPHIIINRESKDDYFIEGYEIMILRAMSDKFNFTYELIELFYDWGRLLPNGTWTGIIGKLAKNVDNLKKILKLKLRISFLKVSRYWNGRNYSYPGQMECH